MNDLLHAAVVNLLDKLDEVTDATIGIFQWAQVHGMTYGGPTYEAEYDLVRTLTGTDRPPRTPAKEILFDRDGCIGCDRDSGGHLVWYAKECPIHGHNSAWKNLELSSSDECNGVCVINPNDIVWFDSDCPVHHSLSDGRSILETYHHDVRSDLSGTPTAKESEWLERHGTPSPSEEQWLKLVENERKSLEEATDWLAGVEEADESDGFLELAETDFARAMSARFDGLRETIRELAELDKEHRTLFRPSKEWLERMFRIEDEYGGHISVGGLAADLGMLSENPDKTFLMMGSNGEPMGTMSNPTLEDLIYYMRADDSSVRLLSDREADLADRCNTYDECPAEDPDVVECPMHPELGG